MAALQNWQQGWVLEYDSKFEGAQMIQTCLQRIVRFYLAWAAFLAVFTTSAHAIVVEYIVAPLGGEFWRYDYTIRNIDPPATFDELTVYFDVSKYTFLANSLAPSGWDPIVVQPDAGLPSNGFYDALSLVGAPGNAILSGFSVSFTYLGSGTPGAQPFELIDSSNFSLVHSGTTQLPVPEPSTQALMLLAGLLVIARTLRNHVRMRSREQ